MEKVEEVSSLGEVTEPWLPRQVDPGLHPGTSMSGREAALRIEPGPTARDGLVLIPATMNIAQAAAYIGIAKSTLYTWRTRRPGFGPRAVKAGGALRYRRSDLEAWIEAHAETLDLAPGLESENEDHDSRPDKPAASRQMSSMSSKSRTRRR